MRSLLRSKKHRVHFIIKDHYIRFVESDKKNTFLSYGQKCLPSGVMDDGKIKDRELFAMILEEIIEKEKLKGSKITFCVPDSYMIIRKTLVPLEIHEDELKGYLYMQLGESIHLPFEDPILEAVSLGQKEGQREVLLIASKESVVREFTEVFEDCSLKPMVADLSILSLYRLYYHLGLVKAEDHVLLIQIGLNTLQLSVFNDHRPEIVRHSKLIFDEEHMETMRTRSGQEFYIWTHEQEDIEGVARDITTEIERFMRFYRFNLTQGNHEITKLVMTGDHPSIETFEHTLKNSFEVKMDTLLSPLFHTKKGVNIPPVFSDCIGLALK